MQALWIGSHQRPTPLQRGLVDQSRVVGQAEHLAQGAEPRLAIVSHAIALAIVLVRPSRDVRYSRENGNLCVKLAASPRAYWGAVMYLVAIDRGFIAEPDQ